MKRTWEELGRLVLSERMAAGLGDTAEWAQAVGRSTRMLLGLERGEQVGPKTLTLIEQALGKSPGWAYRYLSGQEPETVGPAADPEPYAARGPLLEDASLDALLAEIARRARDNNPEAK
jgi:hypothetical protein